jgi:hypothetical protein
VKAGKIQEEALKITRKRQQPKCAVAIASDDIEKFYPVLVETIIEHWHRGSFSLLERYKVAV